MKDKRKTREKKPLSFAIYVMGAFLLTSGAKGKRKALPNS